MKIYKSYLKIFISLLVIGVAFVSLDIRSIQIFFTNFSIIEVGAILLALGFHLVFLAYRWAFIACDDNLSATYKYHFHALKFLESGIYNIFTPGNIGGDAFRVSYLKRLGNTISSSLSLVLCEKVLGLTTYLSVLAVASAFVLWPRTQFYPTLLNHWTYTYFLIILCFLAIFFLVDFRPFTKSRFFSATKSVITYRVPWLKNGVIIACNGFKMVTCHRNRNLIFLFSLLSFILWPICFYILLVQQSPGLSFARLTSSVISTELVRLVPVTVGGIGLREVTFAHTMNTSLISYEDCFLTALLLYALLTLMVIIMAILARLLSTKFLNQ